MAKKKDFYGLTEDDYNEFRKYRASTENVQNLMSQAEKERHYLENDNLSIMERNRALYNHRITLNQLSEVSGAGVSVPGLNSGYMSQLQEQYTRALNRLDNDIKANRLDFGGLGMQTAAGFAPNGTQFDREPLSQHLKPGRGLIDFNTGYPTESNQRAAQENAMRTQYQNIQTEAGQEAARWGQRAAADMDELEQTTYWLDILRGLPKSQDPGIVKNNNDLVAQIAAEAGIANYADADDLSAQLSVRESQLRAKSYWSERMAGRSAGQQRAARAYEYQLDNPNESIEANYYLALRDQAARDVQNVDSFADYFDTKGAVGDWLRYNSAYGDQLYQDQKNEEILAIRSDPNVGPVYQEAMEASRGAGEVANLRAQAHGEMRETGSISAQTEAAIRELAARYGITVGQGDAALEAALEQMHQQNSRNVNVSMARLQAQGYDPKRLRQYIQQALNEERMDAKNAEAREFANEHPVAATVGSSLTNVLSGGGYIASAPQAIGNAISGIRGNYNNYIPIDTNSVGFDQAQYVMAVRDEVTKNIQENGGNDLLYGVGTSILDNMVQMAVGTALMGGAGAVTGQGARAAIQSGMQSAATASLATMGLSAASQELVRLTEQGVSSDQAFALATIRGAVEIVTEKIGIDNFISNLGKKSAGNFVQQIVGMAVQQSAAEGGEEIIAEVAGLYADWLIRQEESDIAKTIEAGRLNGMTESEALWDAFEKYALQVLEAGAAGALSGLFFGAMSTAGMVADAVSPAATGARIRAEGNEPVLGMMASAYGLEYDESMTDRQIGKVYREVQKQADRVTKDMQYGISMESYAQEKGYDTKTAKALNRSWNAYRTVDGNNMSSREFAATWNSVKAAGQANMSFDNAVAELGETTLSRYTLESAWKAGQRLYAQAQKTAKAQPVKPQETVQQQNVPEVKLDTEIGEGVPAQTELVQRTSEKAATYAQQLMGERINVNGLSDEAVESFYDEIDSDIATERQGALAMARMLTGVSKNISQVIFVDSASYDAEGHVRLMSNGMWDPTNRTMTIDINAGRMNVEQQRTFMTRAMSHEITHSLKTTAREQYDELSRFVLREMDKQHNLEALIEAKIKDYASAGVELDREGAIDELVAEACEQMLERTDVLNKLAQENRSLWEKIRDFFKAAIEKLRNLYKGLSPNSTEAKLMQGVINELQAKWDAAFAASLTAEVTETSAAAQHSIAGRNAAIADIVSMENAVRMEEAGHTAPEIYNDTGWFRGADNMWRFEIDDSTMRYYRAGDAKFRKDHPGYVRYQELMEKFLNGTITEDEAQEMRESDYRNEYNRLKERVDRGNAHLDDILDHDTLFAAYPALRDVRIEFAEAREGLQGVYRRRDNKIVLSEKLRREPEATLIHEIQHAIQAMEGFAVGASRAYWNKIIDNGGKIDSKRLRDATAAVRKFESSPDNQEIVDARNRLNSAWEEGAKAGAAMYAQLENEGIAEKVDAYEDMLWEQSNAGVAFLNSTPMELYQNTAGEQEARDVAERRTMTSEQRKGKMPQTGTKDTVFAEGSSASASENGQKNTAPEGGRYSVYDYTKSFAQQLQDWENGLVPSRDSLLVGETPKIYRDIGFNALPMTINQEHVSHALRGTKNEDHEIDPNSFKNLPRILADPVAIIKSKTNETTSVVSIVKLQSINGKQVIAAFYVDGFGIHNGQRINSNAVTTVHGRNNAISGLLVSAAEEELNQGFGIYWINKNEALSLLQGGNSQLITRLPHDGFIHSIREAGSPVNLKFNDVTESLQFMNWFGNWKTKPRKASKVVNSDGTPKVVYHGTGTEFWQFDLAKTGSRFGDVSEGLFFFTNKKSGYANSAGDYAAGTAENGGTPRVMEVYLDIKKPLRIDSKGYYTPVDYFDTHAEEVYDRYLSGDYDGIIIENSDKSADDSVIYMVDDATKIKSATDNVGTFDHNQTDIRYQISRDTASNMDLLMGASMDGLSKAEADHLLRYRDRVNEIRQNQRNIEELKAEELTADINAQIKRLENANSIIYRKVNTAEQTDLMQRIIERERAAGDIEVQRMDNRVADLEDEIDELEQKIRNAKLAGQMGQGRRDAATLRKTEERLNARNEKQKAKAEEKIAKQKQKTAERLDEQKQKYTDKAKAQAQRTVQEYEARLESKRRELKVARESRDRKIAQMQESRVKSMDSRHRTQMRHKIRKVVKELDALLLRGTKDRNIRDEMKAAVASALEAINMDSGDYEGRIAKLDEAIAAATDPVVIATLTESRERIAEQGSNMRARLSEMKTAYSNFSKDTSGNYNSTYDEVVQSYIDATIEKVGATPLWDMTVEQLDSVYNMFKMILTDIQQANKLVRDEKNRTIYSMGNSVIRELDGRKRHPMQTDVGRFLKKFGWDNLKPVYAFETIGSNTLMELYENVRGGEDTWARDVSEARTFYQERAEKYGLNKWDTKTRHKFYSRSGKEFSLDVNQIMSLYAYSKRSQADEHLQRGGFVFDSAIEVTEKKKGLPIKYKVNTKQAYGIDPLTLNDIIGTLTDEQRNFVDEMQAYLSDTMGAKGNEVSLDMYGVRLFNEQNYFPLKTSKQFLFEQNEVAGEVKLKNSGFSKHTTPHASNPVILSNFMDVWGQHVNDMSMYHAFVIPLENFNRVYNYQTLTTDEAEPDSVKGTLADIYGDAPVNYIKQLLTDLNGGARVDPTASVIDWGLSKFKSAAVMASASVVIQQPTAVVRAAAFVNPIYLGAANKQWHKNAWEELKRYAPVAIIKEMGRFDTNMGRSTTDWITDRKQTGLRRVGQVSDDVFSRPASFADEVGWLRIWAAVKKETAKKTDLKPGTQEFLEHCGKRFTYIIERSQVYDSVLSRSATMRSKDTGMKMATAFMAEPLTTMNMLVGSFKMRRNGYRGAVVKTYGAVAASLILNSILVSLVYAARDDDEDETYAEKYFQALSERLRGNALDITLVNTVPFLRDIISIFQGYDVSRTDMSMVVDFYKAYQTIVSDTAGIEDKVQAVVGEVSRLFGLPVKNIWRDAEGIINVVKGYFENEGLWTPENAWGDIREGLYEGFTGKTISSGQKLYEAYMSGDGGKIFVLEAEYQDAYGEDWYKQIQSDLRTHVKGLYLDGDLSYDDAMLFLMRYAIELTPSEERQHEAGTISDEEYTKLLEDAAYWTIKGWDSKAEDSDASTAKYADLQAVIEAGGDGTAAIEELLEHGETEKEIRSGASSIIADLYKNGEIDADTAEAYLAEYAGITDSKDLYTWFTEKDHWVETGENDYGAYGPVWDALIEGGDVAGAIDAMVKAGWTEDAIAQNVRTRTKEWVLGTASDGNTITPEEARNILSNYGGVDAEDLDAYVAAYNFWLDNPEYVDDFSIEQANDYLEYGTGIDIGMFLDFREAKSGMVGKKDANGETISGSVKAEAMAYIDALPITDAQKDQLYLMYWSESKIYEAPWH